MKMVNIYISRTVAEWMRNTAIKIFQDAYATDWTPADAENAIYSHGDGYINELPLENGPLFHWISATMSLIRCLAAILDEQLSNDEEMDSDIQTLSITFGDQAEI